MDVFPSSSVVQIVKYAKGMCCGVGPSVAGEVGDTTGKRGMQND